MRIDREVGQPASTRSAGSQLISKYLLPKEMVTFKVTKQKGKKVLKEIEVLSISLRGET